MRRLCALATVLLLFFAGCGDQAAAPSPPVRRLRIFHAAGITPVLETLRADARKDLNLDLITEGSGSQAACRKIAELGRECDLVILADSEHVATLLAGFCSWRLDLATDEIVLGVGVRAPHVNEAEKDWPTVLLRPDVRLGRVDETQGPIGYRAMMTWQLQESLGPPGLADALYAKCDKVMDDVALLTPLLKRGELDYAFVYKSICIAHDVRYIELDRRINLGAPDVDYSAASVTYRAPTAAGAPRQVIVRGGPVVWTLSIPDRGADAEAAQRFIEYLVSRRAEALRLEGIVPLSPPRFHGPEAAFAPFASFARRVGDLQ